MRKWLSMVTRAIRIMFGVMLLTIGVGGLALMNFGMALPALFGLGGDDVRDAVTMFLQTSYVGVLGSLAVMVVGLWVVLRDIIGHLRVSVMGRTITTPRLIPVPRIRLPRFSLSVGEGRVKYVILGTVAFSGLVVAVGLYFAVIDIAHATYEYPRAGAVYPDLGNNQTLGQPLAPYVGGSLDGVESQTLEISLAANARVTELTFKNMQLGRVGLTDCVVVQRAAGTSGYLYADSFHIKGTTSAPSFDLANSEAHTLAVAGLVDGHTNSSTLDNTVSDITVESERGAGEFISDGGVVDRILITLLGDVTIKTVTFEDVDCSIGGFNLDYIKTGLFQQGASTKFGDGDGIEAADHIINSTVKYRISTDQLIDSPVSVR